MKNYTMKFNNNILKYFPTGLLSPDKALKARFARKMNFLIALLRQYPRSQDVPLINDFCYQQPFFIFIVNLVIPVCNA